MRLLVIMGGYRHQKTTAVLPYSELEYKVLLPQQKANLLRLPFRHKNSPILRILFLVPITVWIFVKAYLNREVKKVIRDFRPDLVYANVGSDVYSSVKTAIRSGVPLVVRVGGHIFDEEKDNMNRSSFVTRFLYKHQYKLCRKMIEKASHIIVVNEDMKKKLAEGSGRALEDISVVSVPCDTRRFDLPKDGDNRILLIMRVPLNGKLQGLLDFLPALDGYSNVRIIAPGRYHNKVVQATRHPVFGYVNDIGNEYQKARVFCYFSYLDGCPNVILEAWASRTPVVTNRCTWSEELIKHNETGLLANNAQEAKQYIKELLNNEELAKRLSDNGFDYVRSNNSLPVVGRKLGQILENIANKGG